MCSKDVKSNKSGCRLAAPQELHLQEMMGWFPDAERLREWGGPAMRFPFSHESFAEDLQMHKLASHILLDAAGTLLGFGQWYRRLDCCHLGRLAIAPQRRGQGYIGILIRALAAQGCKLLQVERVSLFVLENNEAARRAYLREGFREAPYPGEIPMEHCLYMTCDNPRPVPSSNTQTGG